MTYEVTKDRQEDDHCLSDGFYILSRRLRVVEEHSSGVAEKLKKRLRGHAQNEVDDRE